MEDVAEQVDVRALDGLREEEVVRHEGDAVRQVRRDGVVGAADHVGEVLDDEVEVGVGLGEGDADVAAGAADVDHGALVIVVAVVIIVIAAPVSVAVGGSVAVGVVAVDGRPGVAFVQEAGREAEAVGEGGHGARETFGHVRVRGVVLPHGLFGMLGQAPTGFVGLVALEFLHRSDGVRE